MVETRVLTKDGVKDALTADLKAVSSGVSAD